MKDLTITLTPGEANVLLIAISNRIDWNAGMDEPEYAAETAMLQTAEIKLRRAFRKSHDAR